jgi:hypothetical protein
VGLDDRPRNRQAEAAASAAGWAGAVKTLEDAASLGSGDTGAVVLDRELDSVAVRLRGQPHRTTGAHVLERVAHEVADRLRQGVGIGLDNSVGHRTQLETTIRDRLDGLELFGEEGPDLYAPELEAPSLLGASEEQQVVHEPLHPADLRGHQCLHTADVLRADVG